ncbi:hypothetical protein GCM10022239_16390 [Leifsonia bigeumensis]|uniref:Uncharacterized protein n=1 Tax=Leifsonella bigeumensis TaxID=433643 RepID=A0ABP7FL97_9MICO
MSVAYASRWGGTSNRDEFGPLPVTFPITIGPLRRDKEIDWSEFDPELEMSPAIRIRGRVTPQETEHAGSPIPAKTPRPRCADVARGEPRRPKARGYRLTTPPRFRARSGLGGLRRATVGRVGRVGRTVRRVCQTDYASSILVIPSTLRVARRPRAPPMP